MKIVETYADGSRTILLESGDRVRIVHDTRPGSWLNAERNERATVIRRDLDNRYPTITFLQVQTDRMRAGGWGVITVAPWDCEYLGPELAE